MEVVASLSQGRTAAAQCGLFTYKSVPVIFEPPCNIMDDHNFYCDCTITRFPSHPFRVGINRLSSFLADEICLPLNIMPV